jgi:hypothetical protein
MDEICKTLNTSLLFKLSSNNKESVKQVLDAIYKKNIRIKKPYRHIFHMFYGYFYPATIKKYITLREPTLGRFCDELVKYKLSDEEINRLFYTVYNAILKKGLKTDLSNVTSNYLDQLFKIFDDVYFENRISKYIKQNGDVIKFELSNKLQKIAAYCKTTSHGKYCTFLIKMGSKKIKDSFDGGVKYQKVNGIGCNNPLECMINIFSHELTHLIIRAFCNQYNIPGGHSNTFKAICRNLYGHTDFRHTLGINQDTTGVTKEQIRGWTYASFINKNKGKITGKITQLNPRTVGLLVGEKEWRIPYGLIHKERPDHLVNPILVQPRLTQADSSVMSKDKLNKWTHIYFMYKGEKTLGIIKRLNPKTVSSEVLGILGKFKIPYGLVLKEKPSGSLPVASTTVFNKQNMKNWINASFMSKGKLMTGKIFKFNPSNVILTINNSKWTVPYAGIIKPI